MRAGRKARDTFYQRLRAVMEGRGITQTELAKRLARSQSVVSDWLNPERRAMPDGETMLRLPAALGVNAEWLLSGHGAPTDPTGHPVEPLFYRGAEALLIELDRMIGDLRDRWRAEAAPLIGAGPASAEELRARDQATSPRLPKRQHRRSS